MLHRSIDGGKLLGEYCCDSVHEIFEGNKWDLIDEDLNKMVQWVVGRMQVIKLATNCKSLWANVGLCGDVLQ